MSTVEKKTPSLLMTKKWEAGLAAASLLLSYQDPQKKPAQYTRIGQKLSCEKRALREKNVSDASKRER